MLKIIKTISAKIIVDELFELLRTQLERIEELETLNSVNESIMADTSALITEISNRWLRANEDLETQELTSQAFLAVLRSKLRNGVSREEICNNITEYLNV